MNFRNLIINLLKMIKSLMVFKTMISIIKIFRLRANLPQSPEVKIFVDLTRTAHCRQHNTVLSVHG